MLWGTGGLGDRSRRWIAVSVLGLYVVLTGGSPSAMRATAMGVTGVFGRCVKMQGRRLQPLGLLLATAVLLSVIQPLWVENAGFLLSFAATFGLMVSTVPIQKRLDFIPPNLAAAIATPLSALLWTLPLQLAIFGKISIYFLVASLITAPLVTLSISTGLIVAAVSLLLPPVGSLLAWPLRVLIDPLIGFVSWIATWPGAVVYTGTASILQCLTLYGVLLVLTYGDCCLPTLRLRDWQRVALGFAGAFLIVMVIPALWPKPAIQIVTLATPDAPVLIIRSGGQTALINSGSGETVEFSVLPYLRSEGIQTIDRAIALAPGRSNGGWEMLASSVNIAQIWTNERFAVSDMTGMQLSYLQGRGTDIRRLRSGETIPVGRAMLQSVDDAALSFFTSEGMGLIVGSPFPDLQQMHARSPELQSVKWLWWDGAEFPQETLSWLQPELGIVGGDRLHFKNPEFINQFGGTLIWTEEVGATVWTPNRLTAVHGLME